MDSEVSATENMFKSELEPTVWGSGQAQSSDHTAVQRACQRPGLWCLAPARSWGELGWVESSGGLLNLAAHSAQRVVIHVGGESPEQSGMWYPFWSHFGFQRSAAPHPHPPMVALTYWELARFTPSALLFKMGQEYLLMSQVSSTNTYSTSAGNGKISVKNQTIHFQPLEFERLLL